MKRLLLAVVLLLSARVNADSNCSSCAAMDRLTERFAKTNYLDPKQRQEARGAVPDVLQHSARILASKTKPSDREMRSLIRLVAASSPYDVESAGVVDLAILIKRHRFDTLYEQTVKALTNTCDRESLEYYVGQRLCQGKECSKLPPPRDYEDCLLARKKSTR